jgi:biopolymer transport protein ExbD
MAWLARLPKLQGRFKMGNTSRLLSVAASGAILCVLFARTGLPQGEAKPAEVRIPVATVDVPDGVRVAVFWDAKAAAPIRKIGMRTVKSDEEFLALLTNAQQDYQKVKKPDAVVSIDAAGEVPWRDLTNVISACRKAGWKKIEFVAP